uniref:Uncharacterized protein n=1 Tax=Octopus bimaculoides TaxID=37653 RepID=A0A0L8FNK6_OCTBM
MDRSEFHSNIVTCCLSHYNTKTQSYCFNLHMSAQLFFFFKLFIQRFCKRCDLHDHSSISNRRSK